MDLYVPIVYGMARANERYHLDLSTQKYRMLSGPERGLEKCRTAWGKQRAELGGLQVR